MFGSSWRNLVEAAALPTNKHHCVPSMGPALTWWRMVMGMSDRTCPKYRSESAKRSLSWVSTGAAPTASSKLNTVDERGVADMT